MGEAKLFWKQRRRRHLFIERASLHALLGDLLPSVLFLEGRRLFCAGVRPLLLHLQGVLELLSEVRLQAVQELGRYSRLNQRRGKERGLDASKAGSKAKAGLGGDDHDDSRSSENSTNKKLPTEGNSDRHPHDGNYLLYHDQQRGRFSGKLPRKWTKGRKERKTATNARVRHTQKHRVEKYMKFFPKCN